MNLPDPAAGPYTHDEAGVPNWAQAVCAGIWASGSRDVVVVPHNPLSHILRVLGDRRFGVRTSPATREQEAAGLAGGLYLGGRLPTVMMQSSGLGNAPNAICSLLIAHQIPVLLLLNMRGDPGEWNQAQVPLGRAIPHILDAIGVQHLSAARAEVTERTMQLAAKRAFDTRTSAACLLPDA